MMKKLKSHLEKKKNPNPRKISGLGFEVSLADDKGKEAHDSVVRLGRDTLTGAPNERRSYSPYLGKMFVSVLLG